MSGDNDFRRAVTHPTIDDIIRENPPQISPNLINKCYDSTDHYLKTQFDLLREELVRPLIRDVNKLKQLIATEKSRPEEKQRNERNIFIHKKLPFKERADEEVESNVYFDIKLTKPYVEFNGNYGMVLKFSFDYKSLEGIDLTDNQHLMDGGILCLSSDNFEKSIYFGLIVNMRKDDESGDKKCCFHLKLDLNDNSAKELSQFILRPHLVYIGVESSSFYEGFRYSLKNFQNMSEEFPLKRYIVDIKKDINPPKYLTEEAVYDISCVKIIKKSEEQNQTQESDAILSRLSSVRLRDNEVFGDKRAYNRSVDSLKKESTFDVKQFDAFYAALTKELCVIEGPPGTGKTFVGLKIVESLLNNKMVWNEETEIRPILIVCFKNHALDQFLEGIIKFNKNVVRIGGNCESKQLHEYKMWSKVTQFEKDLVLQKQLKVSTEEDVKHMTNGMTVLDIKLVNEYKKCNKIRNRIRSIERSIIKWTQKVERSFELILDFNEIKAYIKPNVLLTHLDSDFDNSIEKWLNSDNGNDFYDKTNKKLKQKRLPFAAFDTIFLNEFIERIRNKTLKSEQKWLLYLYWRELLFNDFCKQINVLSETLFEEMEKLKSKRVKFQRMLCKNVQIIGLTVTGAAKYRQLVEAFNPKIVIVEEAAEVLEGHVVATLSSNIEHMILIGDHKQLRPLTSDQELTEKYSLDISLFERLVKNGLPFIQLELQHRMRPSISELLKVGQIYDNLRNDPKVEDYPNLEFTFGKNIFFIDHKNIEDNNFCRDVKDKSRSNLHEAKFVVQLVKYFLLRNYPEDRITVLATYNAQLALIKRLMFEQKNIFVKQVIVEKPTKTSKRVIPKDVNGMSGDVLPQFIEEVLRVRVSSVDGFQGEENDLIIISFVRSSKRNAIGFLDVKNRVNVALSRARHALFCIGNFSIMAKEGKSGMWSSIVKHLSKKNCFGEELIIGCNCTEDQHISYPGQLDLLNLQLENGFCKCRSN